ncbi:pyridoxamine 5'-phosphate oxidase family protein [Micromonospora tulbaghiae]|uniref:pyridoxamine 5'-phosphate oxidase family protein n=1 Tax=Micromonospora tulbaghiae TaxID=479978 RepID=UPI00371DC1DA
MTDAPRTRARRRHDTTHRLDHDVDCWVATADPDGTPYLVPLSFDWDGHTLLVATPAGSPTGRNLATGRARVGLGPTRDVTMIDGDVESLAIDACPPTAGTASPPEPASTPVP